MVLKGRAACGQITVMCEKYNAMHISEMMSCIKSLLPKNNFILEDEHYAGYFDELNINIEAHDSVTGYEIKKLADLLYRELSALVSKRNIKFRWTVGINQTRKNRWVLFQDGLLTEPND